VVFRCTRYSTPLKVGLARLGGLPDHEASSVSSQLYPESWTIAIALNRSEDRDEAASAIRGLD
jgi:hypothetical protein